MDHREEKNSMNKAEFLEELSHKLRGLPEDDRQDAIRFYTDLIEDAGLREDEDVTPLTGSPEDAGRKILEETMDRKYTSFKKEKGYKKSKSAGSMLWVMILGIFAAPIALPLAIAAFAVIFALVVSFGAVCFGLFVGGIAAIGSAFLAIPALIMAGGIGTKIIMIGSFFVAVGVGLLLMAIAGLFWKLTVGFVSLVTHRFVGRRE